MSVLTAHIVYFCDFARSEIFQENARELQCRGGSRAILCRSEWVKSQGDSALNWGHPGNENQSDGRTETINSNILKSSQSNVLFSNQGHFNWYKNGLVTWILCSKHLQYCHPGEIPLHGSIIFCFCLCDFKRSGFDSKMWKKLCLTFPRRCISIHW